jgi:hypothetical protein
MRKVMLFVLLLAIAVMMAKLGLVKPLGFSDGHSVPKAR